MVVTECLASILGWFRARRRDWKLADVIQNLSLSRIFVLFSVEGILIDSRSRGLKAERGVAVFRMGSAKLGGCRKTRDDMWKSLQGK